MVTAARRTYGHRYRVSCDIAMQRPGWIVLQLGSRKVGRNLQEAGAEAASRNETKESHQGEGQGVQVLSAARREASSSS